MKNSLKTLAAISLTLFVAMPVSALTVNVPSAADAAATAAAGAAVSASGSAGGVQVSAAVQARITKGKDRADQEITRRITALTDLSTRIQAMTRLSGGQKDSLASSISGQVSNLTDLKTKIDSDTDVATLKTDIKSITDAYRIFMLVLPQGRITAAADRIVTVASDLTAFSTKLSARIGAAQSAGKDVATLQTTLTDMNAKIADANTQSAAAVSLVANLTPDNGDKIKAEANATALKSARADIKTATQDLATARQDAHAIVKGLVAFHLDAGASTTASTTTQ